MYHNSKKPASNPAGGAMPVAATPAGGMAGPAQVVPGQVPPR